MEKGGKGFSLPTKTARKSSLKSTPAKQASLKGKDDSSAKSKRGRKVQFDVEGAPEAKTNFSLKSGGKVETPLPKGDSSKWGKGDKTANGGKGSVSKNPQPLELKIEQELPENVKCMMDCEAADILQGIQDQMVILSKDPEFRLPVSFDRGLLYAKRGGHYTNRQSVRQVLQTLTKYGVSDGEICVIANVCPESIDEVFALVPSLKAKRSKLSEPLKDVLGELAKLKKSTSLESQMKSAEAGNPGGESMGSGQSTAGQRVRHMLPAPSRYHRISQSNSLTQPLLQDDEQSMLQNLETEAQQEKNTDLERENRELRSMVSRLKSKLQSKEMATEAKGRNTRPESEVNELKAQLAKLNSERRYGRAAEIKQEEAIERIKKSYAALEDKLEKVSNTIAEMKTASSDSLSAPDLSDATIPQTERANTKIDVETPNMENDIAACLVVLIFLVSILIGINL